MYAEFKEILKVNKHAGGGTRNHTASHQTLHTIHREEGRLGWGAGKAAFVCPDTKHETTLANSYFLTFSGIFTNPRVSILVSNLLQSS